MTFEEELASLAEKAMAIKGSLKTEEATKHSLVLPFLSILGYDVFNHTEVVPEYRPDFGIKSHEKVDYALLRDGQPIILVEAKRANVSLDEKNHLTQLYRYYTPVIAKVGILTNGIEYRFYGDVTRDNVMDSKPFLSVDISNLSSQEAVILSAFSKDKVNVGNVSRISEELYYRTAIRETLVEELKDPQREFVQWLMSKAYEGSRTAGRVKWFAEHVKQALKDFCVANHPINSQPTQEPIAEIRSTPVPKKMSRVPPVIKDVTKPFGADSGSSSGAPGSSDGWTSLTDFEGVNGTDPPPAIRLNNEKERDIRRWNRILWEIAQYLVDKGYLTPENCPIRAGLQAKNFLVHTQPRNLSGRAFHSYRSLSNGLYLETGFSAKNTISVSKFLLEHFGQDPAQVWLKTG